MKNRSKKDAPWEEFKEEDFGDYHTYFNDHDDLNLWIFRRANQAMDQA